MRLGEEFTCRPPELASTPMAPSYSVATSKLCPVIVPSINAVLAFLIFVFNSVIDALNVLNTVVDI